MRKLILTLITVAASSLLCSAQLKAPVQVDTLKIKSMTYHFETIRPENWPFDIIIRTTTSFIFGDQEFKIIESVDRYSDKAFTLSGGNEKFRLTQEEKTNIITISFSDYIFECLKSLPGTTAATAELAPATSATITEAYTARAAAKVMTAVEPNAKLQRRQLLGSIPAPSCTAWDAGTVVVDIWVDNYGTVVKAIPGGEGTTTTNNGLWTVARNSAMKTHFSMSADAPALQQGTVTYIFK